jgi:hypothetical protein
MLGRRHVKWNHQSVKREALKYDYLGKWASISSGSHAYAKRHGLVADYSKHIRKQFRWTKSAAKSVALKYNSKRDWAQACVGSYAYAVRHKLVKAFCHHMTNPRIIWDRKSVMAEGLKYSSSREWLFYSSASYAWASMHGGLAQYTSNIKKTRKRNVSHRTIADPTKRTRSETMRARKIWDYESARLESLKHGSIRDWRKASPGSYGYAIKSKYLRTFSSHMVDPRFRWTLDLAKAEAAKYRSSAEWRFHSSGSHGWAVRNGVTGLISEVIKHSRFRKHLPRRMDIARQTNKFLISRTRPANTIWNHELVRLESLKYAKRCHWKGSSGGSYRYARKNGLLNKLSTHMAPRRQSWTKQKCVRSAKRYVTIKEWNKEDPNACSAARKRCWLDDCVKNLNRLSMPKNYWNDRRILIKEMRRYNTRREFARCNSVAYLAAKTGFKSLLNSKFPLIEHASTSLGERATRMFLATIFNTPFKKNNHSFLLNKKTGRMLELDGYSAKLSVAFEYGDHEKLRCRLRPILYRKLLARDEFKKSRCKEMGIKLLQISQDSLAFKYPCIHLKEQIRRELVRNRIIIPPKFSTTQPKIIQFKRKQWTRRNIWTASRNSRNITDLQTRFGSAYQTAIQLGIIDDIRSYLKRKAMVKDKPHRSKLTVRA